ncbi:hypothetical protein [Kaistella pullorum]|uniref:Uncharacterized protein n=1 Tax=Kaistella pullorum TaxID=2763074 RepID=A0ABR8WPY1_9FLAO|nr:hypothetical protein [Kaistella pullorum]MBD8019120.1 hypothetical protein [Kaistella pullorum]
MKFILPILFIFLNFTKLNSQTKIITENLINEIISDQPYLGLVLNPKSFIPELNNELKKDENFKYTMKEVNEKDFNLYFDKSHRSKILDWREYNIKSVKYSPSKYTLQISTPLFIKNNTEVLFQIKTEFSNSFQIYKCLKNKCSLSYSFGNKIIPIQNKIK